MADLNHEVAGGDKSHISQVDGRYTDVEPAPVEALRTLSRGDGDEVALASERQGGQVEYRVYKIRWFGLAQLILLNIVVSWDVSISSTYLTFPFTIGQWLMLTLALHTVAFLFRSRQHSRRLLLHRPQHNKLAKHRFPLCLRRRSPRDNVDAPYRRPSPRYHHILTSHTLGELDTLWRHTHITAFFRPHNVRTDSHWARSAVRSRGADEILGSLVHTCWSRLCHCDSFPGEPFRWRVRAAY